jgi:ABC-type sugar transport system ATPase subunit
MPDVSPDHRPTGLHLGGISKSYGATRVVCDVDLSIDRGEVVALMGANGAGKSTLAKIASGVVQPDSGYILVAGHAVQLAGPQGARSHGIFIVHQSTDQLGVPGLSVAENLVLDELCNGKIGLFTNRRRIRLRAQARDLVRPFGTEFLWLAKIAGILRFYLRPRWEEISPARSRCRIGHTGSHSVSYAEQKSRPPPQR